MADIIVLLIIIGFALYGLRKGFVGSIVGILALGAAIALAFMLCPIVADILKTLGVEQFISEKIAESISGYAVTDVSLLPTAVRQAIESGTQEVILSTANSMARAAISVISFIIVLIVSRIIIWLAIKALGIISKLPVINFFNRTTGFVLGIIEGVAVVYIVLTIVAVTIPIKSDEGIGKEIENSIVAKQMYQNNPIAEIFIDKAELQEGE